MNAAAKLFVRLEEYTEHNGGEVTKFVFSERMVFARVSFFVYKEIDFAIDVDDRSGDVDVYPVFREFDGVGKVQIQVELEKSYMECRNLHDFIMEEPYA